VAADSSPRPGPTNPASATASGDSQGRLALAAALVLAAACVYALKRADADLWGYLAYGRLFVDHGGPVDRDPFSYTCSGCTWIHFEYLSQISIWLAYAAGGPLGLIALKCLLGGIAVGLVLKTVRAIDPRPGIWFPVYALMLGIVPRFLIFRPQLYTYAFFAFFVDVVMRYLAGRRTHLWLLVPATAIWANLHGGFLAGLGVVGLAIFLRACQSLNRGATFAGAARATGELWLTLLSAGAASFVNPQGWRLWRYVLTELSHDTNRRYIQEWMPLSFTRDAWSAASAILLLVALLTFGAFAWRRRGLPLGIRPWQWLAATVPLAWLTVQSARQVAVLAIWASPVLVLLSGAVPSASTPLFRRLRAALSSALAVPALLTLLVVFANAAPNIGIPEGTLGKTGPFGAVRFIKENRLSGNLYLPLQWGGYATWELYPRIRVSMDGRNVSLYPSQMVRDNIEFYLLDDGDVNQPLRFDSHYLLVPSDSPVLARVAGDGRWRRIFEDPDSVLFVRTDVVNERIPAGLAGSPVVKPTAWRPRLLL
jgi:hypothetical protein